MRIKFSFLECLPLYTLYTHSIYNKEVTYIKNKTHEKIPE